MNPAASISKNRITRNDTCMTKIIHVAWHRTCHIARSLWLFYKTPVIGNREGKCQKNSRCASRP